METKCAHAQQDWATALLQRHGKLMEVEEMEALIKRGKAGDDDARNRGIAGCYRLAFQQAWRAAYNDPHFSVDDLFQEAVIGLMKAVERWRPETGNRFVTAAWFSIHAAISWYKKCHRRLVYYPPRWDEKGVKRPDWTKDCPELFADYVSLHKRVGTGNRRNPGIFVYEMIEDETLRDFVADVESEDQADMVYEAFEKLTEREVDILRRRYLGDKLWEIGKVYGITRERVRQLIIKAENIIHNHVLKEQIDGDAGTA